MTFIDGLKFFTVLFLQARILTFCLNKHQAKLA